MICELPFQGCLYSEQHWKMEIVSPYGAVADFFTVPYNKDNVYLEEKIGQLCLWHIIKVWDFLNLEFLSYNANLQHVQHLLRLLCGIWGGKELT